MTRFTEQVGIKLPIICGAMYPCSNPELIAAVSKTGAIGIVQPLSLVYVHGYDFREGLKKIRSITDNPYGVNILVEKSSPAYESRMRGYLEIALEEGCRFFITALGNPRWVVDLVKKQNGIIYHDVVERKWAVKALDEGVDGLICVNNRAGGHAGKLSPEDLYKETSSFGVPLIAAGGIGDENDFKRALDLGYDGIQMGTRFIATVECREKAPYKEAIVNSHEKDIVLTERVTGIPLSVINTPYVQSVGLKVGPIARWLLQHRTTKSWMRIWYGLNAIRDFKRISLKGGTSKDYWQAGKSVEHIHTVEPVATIIQRFASVLKKD
jgi:nitronate monooxygenase